MTRLLIRAVAGQRRECIKYLKRHLKGAEFVWDTTRNAYTTFLAALHKAGADPAVHMEDDIFLTRDFRVRLEDAIGLRPDAVIQFFSMRKKDLTVGSRWEMGSGYMMLQCTYFPAGLSKALLDYGEVWPERETHAGGPDSLVAAFLKDRRMRYWIHVPNLVEHRVMKSLIDPRRSSRRQSLTFENPIL